jgi:hypothetical protein
MKIKTRKIGKPGEGGQYIIREYDDFEYVNPIHQVMKMYIGSTMSFERDVLLINGFDGPEEIMEKVLFKRAIQGWTKELKKYKSIKLPENLLTLLETERKKDQIKLLKNVSLTTHELIAFIFYAYEKHGYTYSQYKASYHHKGLDVTKLPALIHIEKDGKVNTIGKTKLTEGQLKQVVEHRKVTVSKFLDNGEKWHCFFLTFKSLGGKEGYKDGQPHLHYISNAWNIPRQAVKEQLTSKEYSLPSLPHIDFYTYRNPRE